MPQDLVLDKWLRSFDLCLKEAIQNLHFCLCQEKAGDDIYDPDRPLSPEVEKLLLKYFQGFVQAGVENIKNLLTKYLDVEEVFHDNDHDVAGLVIHSKRPEYAPEQLLTMARSRQGLKMKNRLVLSIMNSIRNYYELFEHSDLLEPVLRRLAGFSKMDYSELTHEARQLLLTRKDKTFLQKTHELIETLWEVLETYNIQPQVNQSGPTSPNATTAAFGKWSVYMPSPNSGGPNAAVNLSAFNVSCSALDLARFPTDSLVAILGHHNPELKKLAIHILILRTFGIRQGKVHDFRVRAQNEAWEPAQKCFKETNCDPEVYIVSELSVLRKPSSQLPRYVPLVDTATAQLPSSQPTSVDQVKKTQSVNVLVAIWSHDALLSYDFLTTHCDVLKVSEEPSSIAPSPSTLDAILHCPNGSLTSRIENNGGASLSSKYVAAGSRLHHMLNAFAGTADGTHGVAGRSQQTTAFLIESFRSFPTKFRCCLQEISALQSYFPAPPLSIDGKILLCVVLDNQPKQDDKTPKEEVFTAEANHGNFGRIINQNKDLLEAMNFNLIWIAFLGSDRPASDISRVFSRFTPKPPNRVVDFLPFENPCLKCFYYRNTNALPIQPHADPVARNANFLRTSSIICSPNDPYVEESLLRHCEIPLFQYLELRRLRSFNATKHPTSVSNVHLFEAIPKCRTTKSTSRFFVRMCTNLNEPPSSEIGLFEIER